MIVQGRIWYIAVARSNQDLVAARWLRDQGFEVYLPKFHERALVGKSRKPVTSLLMSPYVFLRFDASKGEHSAVPGTRGVDRLLTDPGGDPAPLRVHDRSGVRDSIVEAARFVELLKQAEDDELAAASTAPSSNPFGLKRNDRVRVIKPGMQVRDDSGRYVPVEGPIALIDKRHVRLVCGGVWWNLAIEDVVPV